jgi:hypothetical protein
VKRLTLILCAALAIAGCSTSNDVAGAQSDFNASIDNLAKALRSKPETSPPPAPACPPFHAWSDADLKALDQALAPVPEGSPITRMALDWRRYYGDAKACDAAQKAGP